MNIYLVHYIHKDGGYSPGDECVSGGSYDKHFTMVVTASSGALAEAAVKAAYPHCDIKKKSKVLGAA